MMDVLLSDGTIADRRLVVSSRDVKRARQQILTRYGAGTEIATAPHGDRVGLYWRSGGATAKTPRQLEAEIAEVFASKAVKSGKTRAHSSRQRVVAIRDDKKWRGVLFPGPLTHKEAVTAMKKTTKYPWRRLMLEEI